MKLCLCSSLTTMFEKLMYYRNTYITDFKNVFRGQVQEQSPRGVL